MYTDSSSQWLHKAKKAFDIMQTTNATRMGFEALENRALLSGVHMSVHMEHEARLLYVTGTDQADKLALHFNYADPTGISQTATATVSTGSRTHVFKNVHGVRFNLNGGNDTVYASSTNASSMPTGNEGKGIPLHVVLNAGAGNDRITLDGYEGEIIVNGEGGNDTINAKNAFRGVTDIGERSYRSMSGGTGRDRFTGSIFNDAFYGGPGNDTAFGNNGDDFMYGEGGRDFLNGGYGDDTLDGGTGQNTLSGGHGDDVFYIAPLQPLELGAEPNGGYDILCGGAGDDTIVRWWNMSIAPQSEWTYGTLWTSSVEQLHYRNNTKG